jgi:hypothetical protein
MRILYRFGDNDFYSTFMAVFRNIQQTIEDGHVKEDSLRDKEFVCALINTLAYPMYLTYQCREFPKIKDSRFSTPEEQQDFYVGYFRAEPDKIYIDKEIDELLAVYGDGNHSWFVLDTKQADPAWRVYVV